LARFDVRRLAALDMYGAGGTLRRRRLIRAEFVAGALGCIILGVLAAVAGSTAYKLLGAWLIGVGINYVPLAAYSVILCAPGRLEAALSGVNIRAEQRYYMRAQILLAVPLLVALLAAQRSRHQHG
jgi:hypothetical protein